MKFSTKNVIRAISAVTAGAVAESPRHQIAATTRNHQMLFAFLIQFHVLADDTLGLDKIALITPHDMLADPSGRAEKHLLALTCVN